MYKYSVALSCNISHPSIKHFRKTCLALKWWLGLPLFEDGGTCPYMCGCECIPLAIERNGGWGEKAHQKFEHMCMMLAVGSVSSEVRVKTGVIRQT